MTEGPPILHRVTVEFLINRSPAIHGFTSAEDARRCIETVKQDGEAWHIFRSSRSALDDGFVVELSLYRSPDTREWQAQHHALR